MSWNNVDNKHKKRYDKNFVSCEEQYERQYVIDTILDEFPQYTKEKVEAAVNHCCRTIPAPRARITFLECLANYLK
jgi:hypothetical protein